jgi:hypothetical protein
MKLNSLKSTVIAAIACVCFAAPMTSSAQRGYQQRGNQNRDRDIRREQIQRDSRELKSIVDRTERHSNSFRDYFEHNFRSNGHSERWTVRAGYDQHAEHQGRNGQMTLRDAIQNLDEDFERFRSEVDHNGRSRHARDLMAEIIEHSGDVDARIGRVSSWYNFTRDRNWRYDRSDLSSRWRDLRDDIRELNRIFNSRGR